MAVSADHVLYLAAGLFGMAPSRAITNDLTTRANVNTLAAELGNTQFTKDFYPVFNDAKAAKLADILLGNSVSAATKTAAVGALKGMLDANGGNVGSAALSAVQFLVSTSDTNFAAAKTQLQNRVEVATAYVNSKNPTSNLQLTNVTQEAATKTAAIAAIDAPASKSFNLTTGLDNLIGTEANDTFTADFNGNNNTFESGDAVDGGAGTDTLSLNLGNASNFAINATTKSVENVVIRAQSVDANGSSGDNNIVTNQVTVDADRMNGVNYWENSNSRADLVVEDVRILPTQITKDITIAMVETDPGHVDFGFYFDQYSLRAQKNSSSQLTIELADTRSLAAGGAALKDNPYWGFKFLLGGVEQTVTSDAIDAAQTYAELLTAVNAALAANPALAGVTAALGTPITRTDTISGQAVQVTPLILSNSGAAALSTVASGDAWLAKNGVPASSGLHTFMTTASAVSTDKVTSKVILDDVGRGSTGGDLVIGGLSVGDTSTSLGVERFEIEVRDNSKLQTINSTNNTLQEVVIKNGVTSSSSFAYVGTEKDKGNLTVNGNVAASLGNSNVDNNVAPGSVSAGTGTAYGTGIDTALPGSALQHNAYGFSDVRLIDGSAMGGNLAFTAEVTARSIAKYMNLVDTQNNPVETNTQGNGLNGFGTGSIANFQYLGGSGNDTMVVDVDGQVTGSRSLMVAGREDFTFKLDGGAGNDSITLKLANNDIVNGVRNNPGNGQNWYNNQDLNNNITIDGGAGNDTIRTPGAGDVVINGGDGNDTIYTDNTGFQTVNTSGATGYNNGVATAAKTSNVNGVWVFNTLDQTNAAVVTDAFERNINDLRSDTNETYNFYNSKVVVTFKGIPSATIAVAGTGYKTTDLELNQAIKKAINTDPVLSKLLVAEDGPANTLVVKSLIDGVMTNADLGIAVTPLTLNEVTALSATELAAVGAAYGLTAANITAASVHAAMTTAYNAYTTNGDYVTQLANDGAVVITGNNSLSTSDNTITGGAGDDVIVLGTTAGTDATTTFDDSNEVLVYNAAFGKDTVVNFTAAGNGFDAFDFSAFGVKATGGVTNAVSNVDGSVTIAADVAVPTNSTLVAEIKKLYAGLDDATAAGASKHIYVSYDAHNVGKVFQIVDGAAANDLTVTELGSIDLAATAWSTLTTLNFTTASAAKLNGGQPSGGVTPPAGTTLVTVPAGSSAAITADNTKAELFALDVAAAKATADNTQVTLNGFAVAADALRIDLPTADATIKTLADLNGKQGVVVQSNVITNNTLVTFGADANGDVIAITLAGIIDPATVNVSVI